MEQDNKEEVKQTLQEELVKWQTQFDELAVQVKLGSMEAKEKLKEEHKKIAKKLAQAKVDLKLFDEATGAAWKNISDGLKDSFESMEDAFYKARKHYE